MVLRDGVGAAGSHRCVAGGTGGNRFGTAIHGTVSAESHGEGPPERVKPGVANIGTDHAVRLVAGSDQIVVMPGYYLSASDGQPPNPAHPIDATAPPIVRLAIGETEIGDELGSSPATWRFRRSKESQSLSAGQPTRQHLLGNRPLPPCLPSRRPQRDPEWSGDE